MRLLDVQCYLTDRDPVALGTAKQIFDLVDSGWDSDPKHASPGGIFWIQASWSTDRNTVSNMPAAELGVRLYQITGTTSYLDWALGCTTGPTTTCGARIACTPTISTAPARSSRRSGPTTRGCPSM